MADGHDDGLSGIQMSKLDDETPEQRTDRIHKLEYFGPPAVLSEGQNCHVKKNFLGCRVGRVISKQ
ncbi:hypothetical protein COX27_01185 [Candidatus Kuenenbacteria bacterium CG23_combo_of_CG06-09_8_20_14_all_36_9]|nr:MAG: hypothetical protein COX27_01185 [Candidatus Kuenenbacteria bacterium CG23_combo_of_CG06-09_8_20_14_all_36_9]